MNTYNQPFQMFCTFEKDEADVRKKKFFSDFFHL